MLIFAPKQCFGIELEKPWCWHCKFHIMEGIYLLVTTMTNSSYSDDGVGVNLR